MDNNNSRQQHVTKASSDELLRKFAQVGSASDLKKELRLAKRQRLSSCASWNTTTHERRSLLPSTRGSMNKHQRRSSIFGPIGKTWRRTVEGASKVFLEKHYYNRHKRLINDPVY